MPKGLTLRPDPEPRNRYTLNMRCRGPQGSDLCNMGGLKDNSKLAPMSIHVVLCVRLEPSENDRAPMQNFMQAYRATMQPRANARKAG
jgi:hypothetical protein